MQEIGAFLSYPEQSSHLEAFDDTLSQYHVLIVDFYVSQSINQISLVLTSRARDCTGSKSEERIDLCL